MGFGEAIQTVFSKYATFSGRASRSEFWYFALFTFLVQLVFAIVGFAAQNIGDILSIIFGLAVFIPSLAVGARRLHDIDRTGWWQLIMLVPLVGIIVLIVFWVMKGSEGPNRFGDRVV